MFEVNGVYANRKGEYTVVSLTPPLMRVRYTDGTEAELKISVQERIWQNIAVEYEAAKAKADRSSRRKTASEGEHYIKVISLPTVEELNFPGWAERVVMGPLDGSISLKSSDRPIIYALESKTFIAVITITGEAKQANPKKYFYSVAEKEADFFPLDVDTVVTLPHNGVPVEAVELESQPSFKRIRSEPESFLTINEDDFELLAEAISEASEDESLDDLLDDDDIDGPDDE